MSFEEEIIEIISLSILNQVTWILPSFCCVYVVSTGVCYFIISFSRSFCFILILPLKLANSFVPFIQARSSPLAMERQSF